MKEGSWGGRAENDQSPSPEAPPGAREEGATEVSGEEQWRRVGVSRSFRGRRSKEMSHSNTFHVGQKHLLSPKGVMGIEIPQNQKISGGGKGVSSIVC